jgi:hypothetical protein
VITAALANVELLTKVRLTSSRRCLTVRSNLSALHPFRAIRGKSISLAREVHLRAATAHLAVKRALVCWPASTR